MIREETQLLHQHNNQLKVDVANINEYMSQIFNHEQSNQQASSGRFGTLETNINAAVSNHLLGKFVLILWVSYNL